MISGVTTVGTTPTLIMTTAQYSGVVLQNTGSAAVMLGGSAVAASGAKSGPSLPANMTTPLIIPTGPAQKIYGIVATGTSTVAYLAPS